MDFWVERIVYLENGYFGRYFESWPEIVYYDTATETRRKNERKRILVFFLGLSFENKRLSNRCLGSLAGSRQYLQRSMRFYNGDPLFVLISYQYEMGMYEAHTENTRSCRHNNTGARTDVDLSTAKQSLQ